jgi:N-acetylmuramoyl-L-alanine amidase
MNLSLIKNTFDKLIEYGKEKLTLLLVIAIVVGIVVFTKKSGNFVFVKAGANDKIKIEISDMGLDSEMCLDSLSEEDSLFLKTKTFDLPYTPKKIENIAVHITDSRKPIKNSTEKFWKDFFYNVKYPGSYMVGYNYLISYDKVLYLRPINRDSFLQKSEIVWGVANHNSRTVSIAIEGGRIYDNKNKKWIVGLDTRSNRQKFLLDSLLKDIKTFNPNAKIKGHNQFPGVKKSCPNYKVK